MDFFYVLISDGEYDYSIFVLDKYSVEEQNNNSLVPKLSLKATKIKLDSAFLYYLLKELTISSFYRIHFLQNLSKYLKNSQLCTFILQNTQKDLIDYNWNERIYYLIRERCEVDHAFSWLSTLGGAFSALGDYFPQCADTAGKISVSQLKLALRLGDESIVSRCRLYFSLSLIQRGRYKEAKRLVLWEYKKAQSQTVIDSRLICMCKGIWSKLQFEHSLYLRKKAIC